MSNDTQKAVKYLIGFITSIALLLAGVALNNWVDSERKFKEDTIETQNDIKDLIGNISTKVQVHDVKLEYMSQDMKRLEASLKDSREQLSQKEQ